MNELAKAIANNFVAIMFFGFVYLIIIAIMLYAYLEKRNEDRAHKRRMDAEALKG